MTTPSEQRVAHTPGPWRKTPNAIRGQAEAPVALMMARTEEEDEANGHLIAAAPELLECVKYLCDELEAMLAHDDETTTSVRHLIAKAEGRQP